VARSIGVTSGGETAGETGCERQGDMPRRWPDHHPPCSLQRVPRCVSHELPSRVCGLPMLAAKNSRKRIDARSPAATSAGSEGAPIRARWFTGTAPCSGVGNRQSAAASRFRSPDTRRRLWRDRRCPRRGRRDDPPRPDDGRRLANHRRASPGFWRSDQRRAVGGGEHF